MNSDDAIRHLISIGCVFDVDNISDRTVVTHMILADYSGAEELLAPIVKLQTLEFVGIVDSLIGPRTVAFVAQLQNLKELSLHGSSVDSNCLVLLTSMTRLPCLIIGDTRLSDSELAYLAKAMPWCEVHQHASDPPITIV
jgi:hypothetical protein